jgi:hypothetical protein
VTDTWNRDRSGVGKGDKVGKVFLALHRDLRKCLICDGVFTRHAAAEHANVYCRLVGDDRSDNFS